MRRLTRPVIVASAIALIAAFGFAVWGIPYFFRPVELSGPSATFGSQSARALVTAIVDEGQIEAALERCDIGSGEHHVFHEHLRRFA